MVCGQSVHMPLPVSSYASTSKSRAALTLFQMRPSTQETAPARPCSRRSARLYRPSSPEAARADGCILIEQVRIFRAAAFTKVFHLHDLGEEGYVDGGLGRFSVVVSLENFLVLQSWMVPVSGKRISGRSVTHLVERALMPVLLQELLLSFWLLLPRLFRPLQILL